VRGGQLACRPVADQPGTDLQIGTLTSVNKLFDLGAQALQLFNSFGTEIQLEMSLGRDGIY